MGVRAPGGQTLWAEHMATEAMREVDRERWRLHLLTTIEQLRSVHGLWTLS